MTMSATAPAGAGRRRVGWDSLPELMPLVAGAALLGMLVGARLAWRWPLVHDAPLIH